MCRSSTNRGGMIGNSSAVAEHKRYEFPPSVKKAAYLRAGGKCEAVGPRYGLPPGTRCGAILVAGKWHADHYPRPAHDPHPDTRSLGNCVACCSACNMYANRTQDTPREAKIKRVSRAAQTHAARMAQKAGIDVAEPAPTRKPRPKMRSRGFSKQHRPMRTSKEMMK